MARSLPPDAPAPQRDTGPDRLDEPERPSALEKAINRTKRAGAGEGEDEPVAAIFQRVCHEHRSHREQTEQAKRIHNTSWRIRSAARNCVAIFLQQTNAAHSIAPRQHLPENFLDAEHYYVSMSR